MKYKKFKEGATRESSEEKPDFVDAISWTALNRYVKYMTSKKSKFGIGNFKKGLPLERYEGALVRHLDKYLRNKYENGKDELNQDHLSAIVFNTLGIMHEEEKKKYGQKKIKT